MKKITATLPKGMRDFLPKEVLKRRYIIDTIKNVFELYGFMPIETPSMENLDTLTGKYGDEGDKLLFKVLNSGNYLQKADREQLLEKDYKQLTKSICEKGLRYDLTVPLARFVVQHQNDISFPFKRYHIAPVWRADRPQKGRYREFYQCDADIIGSDSLLNEVELIRMYSEVFDKLGLNVTIKVNNRKVLTGLFIALKLEDKAVDIISIIDKIDKVGVGQTLTSIKELSISSKQFETIQSVLSTNSLDAISNDVQSDMLKEGIEELNYVASFNLDRVKIDYSLARGLDYYTGTIFEVVSNDVQIGSLGGGGRYDDLTELFGKTNLTGVGISFGLDRMYDVMEEMHSFPQQIQQSTTILFMHFDATTQHYAYQQLLNVREAGISSEIYPDLSKTKKQMKYAHTTGIPYVAICGEEEIKHQKITLKNMKTGEQKMVSVPEAISIINHQD